MDFKIGWLVELPYNLLGKQTFSQKWPFLCCYVLVNDAFKMVFLRMWNEGTGKDQVSFYMLVARASFARAFLGGIDQSMRWQYWAKSAHFFKLPENFPNGTNFPYQTQKFLAVHCISYWYLYQWKAHKTTEEIFQVHWTNMSISKALDHQYLVFPVSLSFPVPVLCS